MCAHHVAESRAAGPSASGWITWLGGADRLETHERRERSTHAVSGVVVLVNVALSGLAATFAVGPTAHQPILAAAIFALVFALLVGVTARAVAAGPPRGGGSSATATAAVALALVLGGVAGEFAALALFSGSIDRLVQQQAAHEAASAPAVVQLSSDLQQTRDAQTALDHAVDAARTQRDTALEIARCEYHPTTACPQTRITGVPGTGPETRTDNDLLANTQRELDQAVAIRDRRAPELESHIASTERALDEARRSATVADRGVGARWVALLQLTSSSAGTLLLHLMTVGFFVFVSLVPLILRQWSGDTSHDRHAHARIERERAELIADTAIAVKRAEVRAAAETLWAEQQLAQARMAVEAQTEIDRALLQQRVNAAIEATATRPEPVDDDMYLPIAAEAHAASLTAAAPQRREATNLPATVEPSPPPAVASIPTIPDVTRAAARWVRPLVPGFVARAIDTSTHPLRTARQVFEEVEQITFSLKRTRRVTVESEEGTRPAPEPRSAAVGWHEPNHGFIDGDAIARTPSTDDLSLEWGVGDTRSALSRRSGPGELSAPDGPPQLPPARQ